MVTYHEFSSLNESSNMDQLLEVSIPRTQTRRKTGVFSRLYTVLAKQVYELKVILDDSYEFILFKRYKEFRQLNHEVKKIVYNKSVLHKFPGKNMNPMNPLVISARKSGLEKWLQSLLSVKQAETLVKGFLNIKESMIEEASALQKMSADECLIKDFSSQITSDSHSKFNIIDGFEKKYFHKRRAIREQYTNLLIKTLIPLCGDNYIGSKALNFLYKLCISDHNRDFERAAKEVTKFPIKELKKMKLNEYILRQRFSDCEIEAFYILSLFYAYYDEKSFGAIVKTI